MNPYLALWIIVLPFLIVMLLAPLWDAIDCTDPATALIDCESKANK